MFNKTKLRDLLERAAWTFLQAGIGAWAAMGFRLDKVALAGIVGAGLSALKTFVKETL